MAAEPSARNVVAVYGGEPRLPSHQAIDRALREELRDEHDDGLQLFSEYLDSGRFDGLRHEQLFVEYLKGRYSGWKVDLLLATDPVSLGFLLRRRDELFPGVPVVFGDVRTSTLATMRVPPDFVGVGVDAEAEPLAELALRLLPQTRELVIVTGTSPLDRRWEARLRGVAAKVAPSLPVRMLSGLSMERTRQELSRLRPDSVVLFGSFRRDGAGRPVAGALSALEALADASAAPIFHIVRESVGRGALGSYAVPAEATARQIAGLARGILAGAAPADLALPSPLRAQPYVDWRQLRRWNIAESRVPEDAVVLFREPSFWDRYAYHAAAAIALLALQSALIAGLLIQARRGRRAEREAHARRNELAHLSRATTLAALSASIAHELNQPLSAILSNAQAARRFVNREPAELDEVREILDDIVINEQRASDIILTLRRMLVKEEAPKQILALADVVDEALRLLNSELLLRQAAVTTRIEPGCPRIAGDSVQLQQVLVNLILNACDAMEHNAPAERVVTIRAAPAGRGVQVEVADCGRGLAPELLSGSFAPFVTTKARGMGLGLTVCDSIVGAHGGRLRAANRPEGGAAFTFDLPAA